MSNSRKVELIDDYYYFNCPYCLMVIQVEKDQLNCKIFRCGIMKDTFTQIYQHTTKFECDRLAENGLIYGCGKPFKFIFDNMTVEECNYI